MNNTYTRYGLPPICMLVKVRWKLQLIIWETKFLYFVANKEHIFATIERIIITYLNIRKKVTIKIFLH